MKKLIYILSAITVSAAMASCNFLSIDDYFSDEIKIDEVFANKRNVEAYIWGIAGDFRDEGSLYQNADYPGPLATDEAFTMYGTQHGYNGMRYVLGEISASNTYSFSNVWTTSYQCIRRVNTVLARIDEATDITAQDRAELLSLARFMRAYAYYKLWLAYGPVILIGDEEIPSNLDLSEYDRPRATNEETVEYICSELEEAAKYLPDSYPLMEFGRPTKGAAYGLIARVRTYYASPLWNGGDAARRCFGNWYRKTDRVKYVNTDNYDEERWAIAAAACKRVMTMTKSGAPMYSLFTVTEDSETPPLPEGITSDPDFYEPFPVGAAGIDHFKSCSEQFNGEAVIATNPEYVWGKKSSTITANTQMSFPLAFGGWNGMALTQKIVDNYSMYDGRSIDNSSEAYPYSEEGFTTSQKNFSGYRLNAGVYNMYNNREMRFYACVGFSERFWPMSSTTMSGKYNQTITYYYDSPNGKQNSATDYTPTGYVIVKYIHPNDAWDGDNARRMEKGFPIIRYADILLMYAECLNHLTKSYTITLGDQTFEVSRDLNEIKTAFNLVRHRAGMPGINNSDLATEEGFQDLIVKERMKEFLHEGQRYFDVRRWGIYEDTENETIMGMNVDGSKENFYQRTVPNTSRIGARLVHKKLYLMPIPLSEIRKLPSCDQNPGWES